MQLVVGVKCGEGLSALQWVLFFVPQAAGVEFGPKSTKCFASDHMGVEVFEDFKSG